MFPHIHGYLFIFANTEIYVKKYKTHWKIVKMPFDKFFQCMAHLGFNCREFVKCIPLWSRLRTEYISKPEKFYIFYFSVKIQSRKV